MNRQSLSPVMAALSVYIAQAPRKALPAAVAEKTKHHVLDTLAAMVSGSRLLPGRKAISYVKSLGGAKEACVVGSRIVTNAVNAALANGMCAHADETDDSHAASLTHPGCGVVPAALAMAERERRGGSALLRAVALGYDVGCRLTLSLDPYRFREAGHSTHSFGPTFGAAAAAAALAGLKAPQVRHALSYAAQLDPAAQIEHLAILHALFIVRRFERDKAVEQHDSAHVLHADIRHMAIVNRVRALMRNPHHHALDVLRFELVLVDEIEQRIERRLYR